MSVTRSHRSSVSILLWILLVLPMLYFPLRVPLANLVSIAKEQQQPAVSTTASNLVSNTSSISNAISASGAISTANASSKSTPISNVTATSTLNTTTASNTTISSNAPTKSNATNTLTLNATTYGVSRFTIPPTWHDLPSNDLFGDLLTPSQANNRVFVSYMPRGSADGLGNRMMMVNFDMLVSLYLGVGYVHRRPKYGSLSPDGDPLAVERLFGWTSLNVTRESFLKKHCLKEMQQPVIPKGCTLKRSLLISCAKLRSESPYKRLIQVPAEIADCVPKNLPDCAHMLRQFGEKHNEPWTVFYAERSPDRCTMNQKSGNYSQMGGWLRRVYWQAHRNTTVLTRNGSVRNGRSITRALPFEEERLQIAVHVRRGDFFNYTNRIIIPDYAYADVIVAVKTAADSEYKSDVPVTVSIFSEGVAKKGVKVTSMHNMNWMNPIYLTDKAEKIYDPDAHWRDLIMSRLGNSSNVQVRTYIATNTITAIHTMICADVFIASISGMSQQIVEKYARGVVLAPSKKGEKPPEARGSTMRFRYGYDRIGKGEVHEDEIKRGLRGVLGDMTIWNR